MLTTRRKRVHLACLCALLLALLVAPHAPAAYAEPVSAPTETACVH